MNYRLWIGLCCLGTLLSACSVKKNNFFSRNYHQMTTRYNVYFNGNEALKAGIKKMEQHHKEDYTNLLPVFVSNNEQTRALCSGDMDYAIEKAAKAIDKHSITVKPRRRKNKNSHNYETFRRKKEFNKQLDKCYVLLGKAYFFKKKFAMANNTFRFIQRQYAEEEQTMTETAIWMFRSLTEMGHYEEAQVFLDQLQGVKLKRHQKELVAAARTDFYVHQGLYAPAITEAENLVKVCKNLKRRPRYQFMLSQLYLKENKDHEAMLALKRAVRFNFNYEMVFNAKINMALAYQSGNGGVEKKLKRMLRDPRNTDFRDRIYYALANIEEKRGDESKAVDLYWKSVRTSVDNDNQRSLSFYKLGGYYFKERDYIQAQSCYDSCLYFMDSRYEDYDQLKILVTDLTELVSNLQVIQRQDSLLQIAGLPEAERNRLIDDRIQEIKDKEQEQKEAQQREQAERNFFDRNNMLSRGNAFTQNSSGGGEWYFYNPVTVAMGKNDFKRKWGRRKLEDNWRRQNKASVDFGAEGEEELAEEEAGKDKEKTPDNKSREYYLQDIPLTAEQQQLSEKKIEDAYNKAGELYMYKFKDPEKALECFDALIRRFPASGKLPMVYYLSYTIASQLGENAKADTYRRELLEKFPESDFAKGLQDPEYFRKVDSEIKIVDRMYAEAYARYQRFYYPEARKICEDILKRYPDNKLKGNVLFLRAMCIVNTAPSAEGREALEEVLAAKPTSEIRKVVDGILASMAVGENPVFYTQAEMGQARFLQSNRHWRFDAAENPRTAAETENKYQIEKEKGQAVVILLPADFSLAQLAKLQARLAFINAAEAIEGKNYEVKKENLWYKNEALVIRAFDQYEEAAPYLTRVATDKFILKILGDQGYRIFAITDANLALLKRIKNVDQYVDFFAENYFDNRRQGEIIAGKWGAAAHIFSHEESQSHDFVLMVPFREINVNRLAETLHQVDPAFLMLKEDYDSDYEMIVVRNIGNKTQALDYMNDVLKSKELFARLAGIDYHYFVITENNLKALQENQNIGQYLKFFEDNYMKTAEEVGVEDGDFVYNKGAAHKFVLFYPNKVDPFKLKAVFEEFNFAGLTLGNVPYNEEHDCMLVSGFSNKEEAMRYFNTVVNNRKLFKPLRNLEYTNFIITDLNLETLREKQILDAYLEFFKKYYLNN